MILIHDSCGCVNKKVSNASCRFNIWQTVSVNVLHSIPFPDIGECGI